MKLFKYWHKENHIAFDNEKNEFNLNCWAGSEISEDDAKEKAYLKLQQWISRLAQGKNIGDYEYQNGEIREQLIEEIYNDEQRLIAGITRNRYGALVLNTDAVVFVDIDIPSYTFGEWFKSLFGKKTDKRKQTLEHIKSCHANYPKLNFIIYETFAGFRVIITGHNYAINSVETTRLFQALQADRLYTTLCKVQQCFRARLTPKPWRCHSARPPYYFPRDTIQQQSFDNWLNQYQINSENYAVCYKIEQLGKHLLSSDEARIIALHDEYVLENQRLPLA